MGAIFLIRLRREYFITKKTHGKDQNNKRTHGVAETIQYTVSYLFSYKAKFADWSMSSAGTKGDNAR